MPTLQNWSLTRHSSNAFLAPELAPLCLQGKVYDHPNPRHWDGKGVVTSPIINCDGRLVVTRSRTVYRLGRIDPQFRHFMRKSGLDYDPQNPLAGYPLKCSETSPLEEE